MIFDKDRVTSIPFLNVVMVTSTGELEKTRIILELETLQLELGGAADIIPLSPATDDFTRGLVLLVNPERCYETKSVAEVMAYGIHTIHCGKYTIYGNAFIAKYDIATGVLLDMSEDDFTFCQKWFKSKEPVDMRSDYPYKTANADFRLGNFDSKDKIHCERIKRVRINLGIINEDAKEDKVDLTQIANEAYIVKALQCAVCVDTVKQFLAISNIEDITILDVDIRKFIKKLPVGSAQYCLWNMVYKNSGANLYDEVYTKSNACYSGNPLQYTITQRGFCIFNKIEYLKSEGVNFDGSPSVKQVMALDAIPMFSQATYDIVVEMCDKYNLIPQTNHDYTEDIMKTLTYPTPVPIDNYKWMRRYREDMEGKSDKIIIKLTLEFPMIGEVISRDYTEDKENIVRALFYWFINQDIAVIFRQSRMFK